MKTNVFSDLQFTHKILKQFLNSVNYANRQKYLYDAISVTFKTVLGYNLRTQGTPEHLAEHTSYHY